ncbi:serine/threonine-protein kinase PLK1-like [Gordionus sp. m RMFG-2023]|uniref:serine/threonine-protein kinase PLK1-like n=1 Tax=Gordionus sp. m RMFG-2023 TaxID=3053472 RepID=UPI0031FC9262
MLQTINSKVENVVYVRLLTLPSDLLSVPVFHKFYPLVSAAYYSKKKNSASSAPRKENKKVLGWSLLKCFGARKKMDGIRPDGLVLKALLGGEKSEGPIFRKCFENRGVGRNDDGEDGVEKRVRGTIDDPCKDTVSYPNFDGYFGKIRENEKVGPVDVKIDGGKMDLLCADYEIIRLIGKGGFAKVFLVRSKRNGQEYAAKVIKKRFRDHVEDIDSYRQVHREKNTFDKIQNLPFLVELFMFYDTPMNYAFIMEYVDGGDLHRHLQQQPHFKLPEHHARFYAGEITLAIHHLHSEGIIHRDIKPENILLCSDGHIKLADYGLCTDILVGRRNTLGMGTTCYCAPESTRDPYYNFSIDWWALGVVLYEMLVGELPFGPEANDTSPVKLERIPKFVSSIASSIIKGFLTEDPLKRLGSNGVDAIKSHGFFAKIDWQLMEQKMTPPPYTPETGCYNRKYRGVWDALPYYEVRNHWVPDSMTSLPTVGKRRGLELKNMTQTLKGINYIRNNSSIVNTSHLLEILNDHGNITLFLPISNSGFGLERNIIPEYLHRGLILNDMRKVTMGNESHDLHFTIHKTRTSTRWAVNCVPVIKDYFTTQGMIYKLKEDFPRTKQTVYDFLKQQELNSTMAKYLIASGLANLTLNPGKYHTIILPSNSAINQLSPQLIQELEFNVKCAKDYFG